MKLAYLRTGAVLMVLVWLGAAPLAAAQWSWDSLVEAYGDAGERREEADRLHRELSAAVEETGDEKILWESMWSERDLRRRASLALFLVDRMFPEGDPGRWEEVEGFWHPSLISRSLASLDALFVAALSLVSMPDEAGPTLALQLLRRLARSPRARYHALLHAPREYEIIRSALGPVSPPLPGDVLVGRLPLARPVRGWISEDRALQKGFTFLDGFGVVSRGGGPYAWDRAGGKIYRVRDGQDRLRWIVGD